MLHSSHNERGDHKVEPNALAVYPPDQEQSLTASSATGTSDDGNCDESMDVFAQFLEKVSAACELFRYGKAWQALQASCQYVWNAIWIAWISPDHLGASSSQLDRLSLCVDALLHMVEAVVVAVKDQNALGSSMATSVSGSQTLLPLNCSLMQTSLASTVVVSSAMNAMSADVTWIVNFVSYALKAYCAQKKWETIVRVGKKFHSLLGNDERGGRFSERNFPLLIFAQRQLLDTANAILTGAERDLATFVREFTESEVKKKKKKSRLVVEEVLTPEELDFRAKRTGMEDHIRLLTETRNRQRDEMQQLNAIYDSLTKSTNKCVQALDAIHELVETYHRGKEANATSQNQQALKNQILSAYNHCILLSRQKRQQQLVCQAYQEVGDFHLACGEGGINTKLAVKSWHECLDNAFGALNVVQSWREVLARSSKEQLPNGVSGAEQIQGDGLWIALTSCSTLSKLVMHATSANCFQAVEYSLMAAKVFNRLFASSMPHPTKEFFYGSYEVGNEFWPGRDLVDPERVSPFPLGLFFILAPEVLLGYESYAETAMPVIAGYEFVARYCLESKNHVANARRLRVEALSQCGRISEALTTLVTLFDGVDAASMRQTIKSNGILTPVTYHDSKPLKDEANAAALAWLTELDVSKMHADLTRAITSEPLVLEILVAVLRLVVRLSRHESNLADGSSPIRPVAETMAIGLLQLLDQSKPVEVVETKPSQGNSAKGISLAWEDIHAASARGEILLQQSYLAYSDGQWSLARELSIKALNVCMDTHQPSAFSSSARTVALDLEQELKFCLFRRPSTFVAKCRLQSMLCDLAQGHFHAVLSQAEVALHECRETGEDHLSEQIKVLCCQALVFLGKRDAAETDLEKLRVTAISRFTNCSLTFVHSLLVTSAVLRAKVLLTAKAELLIAVKDRLIEAERVLDGVLERSGWIGVDDMVDLHAEKRLILYNPGIPSFVLVKAALAQTLVECAIDFDSETLVQRQTRVLKLIEKGLRATRHTTRRVDSSKALLLLLKGSVLKKILIEQHSQLQHKQHKQETTHKHARHDAPQEHVSPEPQHDDKQVADMFAETATSLTDCIETSIHSGGYDRRLVRMALLELVDLYGQKFIPGNEDEHVQAAYHYLSLAVLVQSHEFVLFETLELQSGTITSLDKLPPFILSAISGNPAAPSPVSLDKKSEPPAAAAKKGSVVAVGDPGRPPPPEAACLINYYLRLQREQHVLPACTAIQQEAAQWLHTFLLQNHSSYAKSCCLFELPKVRAEDPEIKASLVCVQWGKDLTPAIIHTLAPSGGSGDEKNRTIATRLTLYFTLGTTRIDILCNEELVAAAMSRVEIFLQGPLLSKRPGLDEKQINTIRTQLSHLRTRMEDEESLVIDRGAFESELLVILYSIQQVFRPSDSTRTPDDTSITSSQSGHESASSSALVDVFGNPIHLPCTLEMVRSLEDLFTVQKGVSLCDNVLCYFLRDLLELEA